MRLDRLLSEWYWAFRNEAITPLWEILETSYKIGNAQPGEEACVIAVGKDMDHSNPILLLILKDRVKSMAMTPPSVVMGGRQRTGDRPCLLAS